MTETQESIDLVGLFEAAAKALDAQKDDINALDGFNGNHGDNMVQNVRIITDTVRAHKADSPDEALRSAGAKLREQGQGGTSQYYSRGLLQAADQLSGKTELKAADGISLIQSLLGAIPAQGSPAPEETTPSVLDLLMGSAGTATQAEVTPSPQQSGGGLLDILTGLTGAGVAQPQAPSEPAQPEESELDMGDILAKLLPAGLAYLQAKQAGADSSQAMQAALVSAVLGTQPAQAQTPRQGAGAALAQGMLKALLGQR